MRLNSVICTLALMITSANMAHAIGHFDHIPPAQAAPTASPTVSGADADSLIKSLVSVFNGVSDELAVITRSLQRRVFRLRRHLPGTEVVKTFGTDTVVRRRDVAQGPAAPARKVR